MESSYDICFAGEILEGQTLATVRLKLGKLFKADEATLEKLFSGKVQVLKRDCDREMALKYKRAMERAGAKVIVRDKTAGQTKPATEKAPTQSGDSAAERIARLAGAPDMGVSTPTPGQSGPDTGNIDLAPAGSEVLRPEERRAESSPEIDTSAIELMDTGVDLSDAAGEAPPAPDVSHLSMGEVGEDIPTLPSTAQPLSPDISGIALSPEDTDFSDCAPPPAVAAELDLSALDLAPSGADLLDTPYRTKEKAEAPDTDHLGLADDAAQDD
jgi:hypothetical protein